MKTIETTRLLLRPWIEEDIAPFTIINQDPKVIEYLRGPLNEEEVKAFIQGANQQLETHGCTLWAATLKENQTLIGFIGLNIPNFEAHFTPCVEVGWRLGSQYWGKGYAQEGAKAVLRVGFESGLSEIVSFTVPANLRSIHVMERIGMKRDEKGDFRHPNLPFDHPLSQHVLYRLTKESFIENS